MEPETSPDVRRAAYSLRPANMGKDPCPTDLWRGTGTGGFGPRRLGIHDGIAGRPRWHGWGAIVFGHEVTPRDAVIRRGGYSVIAVRPRRPRPGGDS